MTDQKTRYQKLVNAGFSSKQVPIIDSIQQGTSVTVLAATATVVGGVLKSATVATPTALVTVDTAGASYTAAEQTMLGHLKTDVTNIRTSLAAVIANLKTAGAMS